MNILSLLNTNTTRLSASKPKYALLFPFITLLLQPAIAHQKAALYDETSLNVLAAVTYRNNAIVEQNQRWQPQGFLVGGEALPATQGVSLDDIQLQGYLNIDNDYYIAAKLSSHSHGSESSLALENIWLGTEFKLANQRVQFEAGKMATEVTDTLNYHASTNTFDQAPLSADLFFGRHFNDIGVRVSLINTTSSSHQAPSDTNTTSYRFGVEAFNGDNFPASSGQGTISTFAHFAYSSKTFNTSAKLWAMYSDAEQRTDERYSDGHNHGVTINTAIQSYFTGNTVNTGLYLDANWHYQTWQFNGEFEWIQAQTDGQIFTTTQSAYTNSTYDAYRIASSIKKARHRVSLAYEILSVQNQFSQTTQTFISQVGLSNHGVEPKRFTLAWHYDLHRDFTLRTQWMRDQSIEAANVNNILSLGVQWRYNIL